MKPFIIFGIIVVGIAVLIIVSILRKKSTDIMQDGVVNDEKTPAKNEKDDTINNYIKEVENTFQRLDSCSYINHSIEEKTYEELKPKYDYLRKTKKQQKHGNDLSAIHRVENLHEYVEEHNKEYVINEKQRCNDLFSDIMFPLLQDR